MRKVWLLEGTKTKLCLEIHCLCISLAFVFGRDVIVGMQKKGSFIWRWFSIFPNRHHSKIIPQHKVTVTILETGRLAIALSNHPYIQKHTKYFSTLSCFFIAGVEIFLITNLSQLIPFSCFSFVVPDHTLDLSPAHIPRAKAEPCIIIKSLGLRRKLHVTTKRQDHH